MRAGHATDRLQVTVGRGVASSEGAHLGPRIAHLPAAPAIRVREREAGSVLVQKHRKDLEAYTVREIERDDLAITANVGVGICAGTGDALLCAERPSGHDTFMILVFDSRRLRKQTTNVTDNAEGCRAHADVELNGASMAVDVRSVRVTGGRDRSS